MRFSFLVSGELDGCGNGARGRIRTCTGGALDAVPLLLGYASFLYAEIAPTAGLAPANDLGESQVARRFAFVGMRKRRSIEELHPRPG